MPLVRSGTGPHDRSTRDGRLVVAAVALVAALLAAAGPASPTGSPVLDAIVVVGGVGVFVLIGSRAPWWAAAVAAGIALAIAVDPILMIGAAAALGAALYAGWRPEPPSWALAISLGVTANVLARAELGGRFGSSAAVALTVGTAVVLLGTWRLPRRARRWAWLGIVGLGLVAGAATAGFGIAAVQARHDLAAGLTTAELGVAALEAGDYDGATEWFAEANGYLDTAYEHLDRPWAKAAAIVPVVAQHQRAVHDMSAAGAESLAVVSSALAEIDLDDLRPTDGRFDLDALAALDDPLTRVRDALVELRAVSVESSSPWLVDRATYELDDFRVSVDEHLPAIENALHALRLAPAMLGADGPRTYLLLFTTPSESRGLGGFVGSYAELRADDGQLSLGGFGRAQDLDRLALEAGAAIEGQDDFLRDYGRFGFDLNGDGSGVVGDSAFRNMAMSPDFPTVAEIAADLYADTTGTAVDGVIVMDPFVVTQLMGYTGPVAIPSLGRELGPDEALGYLLRDQYLTDVSDEERADGLAEAAAQAFAGLLSGALPEPVALATDLGPLTSQRRLLVWSTRAEEQDMIETVHISGEVPPLEGADGWAFTVSNAGGSKIDTFLDRRAGYTASTDADTGVTTGTVRIELTNTAPAEGLPRYVIGNRIGQPEGTSSMWVTVYSPLDLDRLTVDGAATGFETGAQDEWRSYRVRVDIPAGGTVVLEAELSGSVADPDRVVTWTQPMERDLQPL